MTEQQLHIACADFLRLALPVGARFLHIPMYAPNKVRGAINKRMGAEPGWPDFLVWYHPGEPPIGIELKTDKGRLSEAQKALHEWAADMEFNWHVCRSVDDVENVLRRHSVPIKVAA